MWNTCCLFAHLTWILVVWCLAISPNPPTRVPSRSLPLFLSPSFSFCLTCGSTWQHFSSSLSLCFWMCLFWSFNKEKLVLPQSILKSNFQNKGLEGVTTWNLWAEVVPSCLTLNYFLNVVVILPISLQLSSLQPGKCSVTNKEKMKQPADVIHPAPYCLWWHQFGVESQKWTNMRSRDKKTSVPHACHHCPPGCKPCTVVRLVAETWLV